MKLKAIIIDDEQRARDVLNNLIARFCPQVEVIALCENVLSAVEQIKKQAPDIVFSDIEMPQYAGYELVNFIDKINFEIIFVTAYDQYAVRAFEVAAIDYLLKPVEIDRLRQAVARVEARKEKEQQTESLLVLKEAIEKKKINSIVIFDKGQRYIVPLTSIIAIEARESYCNIFTTEKQLTASKNLKHFENSLEGDSNFFRVHKSWIVNKCHLQHYSKTDLTIQLSNQITTKLSKYRKLEFEQFLKQ